MLCSLLFGNASSSCEIDDTVSHDLCPEQQLAANSRRLTAKGYITQVSYVQMLAQFQLHSVAFVVAELRVRIYF